MAFLTTVQSILQKIKTIFSIITNLDEVINKLETANKVISDIVNKAQQPQKAYYGINAVIYSFDGKTFESVLKLTKADLDEPQYISGMSTMCTINKTAYFNINGVVYSFDGTKFMKVLTLDLPNEVTPNMVNEREYIGTI
jgi:hypothetical protein